MCFTILNYDADFIYLFHDVVLLMAFSCPIRLAALINARLSLNFDKNCCLNF